MFEYKMCIQEGILFVKYFGFFKCLKILWYNKIMLVSLSKFDVIRKGQEMVGIVKIVIKIFELEDFFKIFVVDYLVILSIKIVIWSKFYVRYFLKYVIV